MVKLGFSILLVTLLFTSITSNAQSPYLNFFRTIGVPDGNNERGVALDYNTQGDLFVIGETKGKINVRNSDSTAQMNVSNIPSTFIYNYDASGFIKFAFTIRNTYPVSIKAASDGSCFALMSLSNSDSIVDVDPNVSNVFNLPNASTIVKNRGLILAKYANNGSLLWAFYLNRNNSYHSIHSTDLAVDDMDNVFIAGYRLIDDTIDVDPSSNLYLMYPNYNGGSLLKYNSFGQFKWGKSFEGFTSIVANELELHSDDLITTNSLGHVIIAGTIDSITDVDPSPSQQFVSHLNGRLVVATYDSLGNFEDVFNIGETALGGFSTVECLGLLNVATDKNDNIYILGKNINGDFDPSPSVNYSLPTLNFNIYYRRRDYFLASYSRTGDFRWGFVIPQYANPNNFSLGRLVNSVGIPRPPHVTVDPLGNSYMTIAFTGQYDVDFGSDSTILGSGTSPKYVQVIYDSNGYFVRHDFLVDSTMYNPNSFHTSDLASGPNCDISSTGSVRTDTTISLLSNSVYLTHGLINGLDPGSDATVISHKYYTPSNPNLILPQSEINICEGDSANLVVSGVGVVSWYDTTVGGNALFFGNEIITPPLFQTTTYYVQDSSCSRSIGRTAITVHVTKIDSTITQISDTLWVGEVGATYQWINCKDNSPIAGEINQFLKIPRVGSYAVRVTKGYCMETSPCYIKAPNALQDINEENKFSIYPNPTNKILTIKTHSNKFYNYQIINVHGAKVKKGIINNKSEKIDVSNLVNGMYYIQITNLGSNIFIKE